MFTKTPRATLPNSASLSRRKPRQGRAQRLTCLRRAIIAAPAGGVTFVDAAAGAVLALRGADVAATDTARAGAFFEASVDGGGVAIDEGWRGVGGDGAEGQRGEEEDDGLGAHFGGSVVRGG